MLNGLDPIIIFNLKKRPPVTDQASSIPILPTVDDLITLPSIPVYLSERLTGVLIENEEKSLEVQTDTNSASDGGAGQNHQRAISSTITITLVAKKTSIGSAILAALADLIFPLVTSKEYSITYLHGAVTIFNGLLNSFSINQDPNNDLYRITISLIKPAPESRKTSFVVPAESSLSLFTGTVGPA